MLPTIEMASAKESIYNVEAVNELPLHACHFEIVSICVQL